MSAHSNAVEAKLRKALREFIERYADDPRLMVVEVWGKWLDKTGGVPDEWQDWLLAQYAHRERQISVKSGHGVGKTACLAWIVIHHALTRFPQKTAVTAPTSKQLWDALWPEVKMWLNRLPEPIKGLFDPKSESIDFVPDPDSSFISARTSRADQPEALAGIHSDNVLLIADEASGIPEQVFEAASGSMSGENAITILTGNPVRRAGLFYDTHNKLKKSWKTRTVSCLEVSERNPKLVSPKYAVSMRERYGEESNRYRVRVLGEFPTLNPDTVIAYDLVELALDRDVEPIKTAGVIWGLDCARFGNNRTALAKRRENAMIEPVKWWRGLDTAQIAGRVAHEYETTSKALRPAEINVDVIGVGAGVLDRLRELGLPARGINVSEAPPSHNKQYANLRTELWVRARDWFNKRDCRIAVASSGDEDDDLVAELTLPWYKFMPASGKMLIASKLDMEKKGAPSPDLADAFVLTFASTAVTLLHGRGARRLNQPLRRPLKRLS